MQTVEITNPGYHLRLHRGFLEVVDGPEVLGKVVLDDIETVIISVPGCSITTGLLDTLASQNVPVAMCGKNYLPSSILLPLIGKNRQLEVMQAQTAISQPQRKRLWQSIVKQKIKNQAELLKQIGSVDTPLVRLQQKVKSGDPDNCEAQAAKYYWGQLMGKQFKRDRQASDANMALNYSYTVLRAGMARAVVATGLHPSFSLHHRNPRNPLNLVDDLMEPFRPIADYIVYQNNYTDELQTRQKSELARVLQIPVMINQGSSPTSLACLTLARSLAKVLLKETGQLELPWLASRIEMQHS